MLSNEICRSLKFAREFCCCEMFNFVKVLCYAFSAFIKHTEGVTLKLIENLFRNLNMTYEKYNLNYSFVDSYNRCHQHRQY